MRATSFGEPGSRGARAALWGLSAAAVCALAGCASGGGGGGSASFSARHAPLYRAAPHTSTITARAKDPNEGVAEIRIDAIEGDLTACTETATMPSLVPCRANAVARTRLCSFANDKGTVSCALALPLGDRRLVTYTATVRNGAGDKSCTSSITYAAGGSPTQTVVNTGGGPSTIAWETARPVWWHTDDPAGGAPSTERIGVGFFPDANFGADYRAFTDALEDIALDAYFDTSRAFSRTYTEDNVRFDLWAGPAGADGEGCTRTFTGWAATLAGATDGEAILHRNAFRDCAAIALGGSGTTQTTVADAAWVFTHESGHFLHGLGDEYTGGGNASVSDPASIYASRAACETSAAALSISQSFCRQIGATGTWRMDDGAATTMEDRVLTSDWRTASRIAVARRMSDCASGACY